MKKPILILSALCFWAFQLNAQVIINENFDSYTAGNYAAQQLGAPWTTWSNTPGSTEDPMISATQASSPLNSVYIAATTNDFVVHLSDKTTGRYKISFDIFVETGKLGYFNILNDFAGSTSIYAMQAYFKTNGYCVVDAAAESADSLSYTQNTWNTVVFVVDVDDDFATMYLNGTELVSWVFSSGSFGTGTSHKLDALDFFGWDDGVSQPGFYLDNFVFEQVTIPEAPINLSAVLTGNDVALSWTAPTGSPDGYSVMRNNGVVASSIVATTYDDNGLYPQSYNYVAKAHYDGLGYSHSSNDTTVTPAGGIARNLVLFEITTCVGCYYCPGAALGAEDLITNGKNVAVIEYHNNLFGADPYTNTESEYRCFNYYGYTTSDPNTVVDGTLEMEGGNHTTSIYSSYLPMYDARIARNSIHDIDIDIVKTGVDAYTATVTVVQTNGFYANNLHLRAALTESSIAYSWQGQTELNSVFIDMYPNTAGYALDFSTSDTAQYVVSFSTTGSVANNCEFIAFVQYDGNKDVTQAAKVDIASIVGVEEATLTNWMVYPNPASSQITIAGNGQAQYEIMNVAGQVVMAGTIENDFEQVSVSNLVNGLYFVRITGSDVVVKSFVVE